MNAFEQALEKAKNEAKGEEARQAAVRAQNETEADKAMVYFAAAAGGIIGYAAGAEAGKEITKLLLSAYGGWKKLGDWLTKNPDDFKQEYVDRLNADIVQLSAYGIVVKNANVDMYWPKDAAAYLERDYITPIEALPEDQKKVWLWFGEQALASINNPKVAALATAAGAVNAPDDGGAHEYKRIERFDGAPLANDPLIYGVSTTEPIGSYEKSLHGEYNAELKGWPVLPPTQPYVPLVPLYIATVLANGYGDDVVARAAAAAMAAHDGFMFEDANSWAETCTGDGSLKHPRRCKVQYNWSANRDWWARRYVSMILAAKSVVDEAAKKKRVAKFATSVRKLNFSSPLLAQRAAQLRSQAISAADVAGQAATGAAEGPAKPSSGSNTGLLVALGAAAVGAVLWYRSRK